MRYNSMKHIISLICGILLCSHSISQNIIIRGKEVIESTYNGNGYNINQTIFDGFGRPLKIISKGASPAGKDIVNFMIYDCMGRADSISYLPYVGGSDIGSIQDCINTQAIFYRNYNHSQDANYANSGRIYDKSPLSIVLGMSAPGAYHNANSPIGHTVRIHRSVNQDRHFEDLGDDEIGLILASEKVKKYRYIKNDILRFDGWYNDFELLITEEFFDDAPDVKVANQTYMNAYGQIIAKAKKINDQKPLFTYYVYDDYGNLGCIVPPSIDSLIVTSNQEYPCSLYRDKLVYYEYNVQGDRIKEFNPGQEHLSVIYDKNHRPVLSQDGNKRKLNQWLYTKYDDFNRVSLISVVTTNTDETSIRSLFMDYASPMADVLFSEKITKQVIIANYKYYDYDRPSYKLVIDDATSDSTLVERYSNYILPKYLAFKNVNEVVSSEDVCHNNTGLKQYEKIAIVPKVFNNSTAYIERAYYYDNLGRIIQTVVKNQLGGITRISNKYSYNSNMLVVHESRQISKNSANDIKITKYSYDDFGRLLTDSTQLNNSPIATVQYKYDELGRCQSKTYGNNVLKDQFLYGITGNLLKQRNQKFSLRLYYEKPEKNDTKPNYSGMITECSWRYVNTDENNHTYAYSYTPYGQFKGVELYARDTKTNEYVENNIEYDIDGNILSLQRTSEGAIINDNSYNYKGYQLTHIEDAIGQDRHFRYDANGNMTFDDLNNWNYNYNCLNLLDNVTDIDSNKLVSFSYLADGTKIEVVDSIRNGYTYLGSLIYKASPNGRELEGTNFSGGRIIKTSSGYEIKYYVCDYQGSVRLILNEDGQVDEYSNYYPFGSRWNGGYPRIDNRYQFNGKEYLAISNLNLLDYGARLYDPLIGRWFGPDPAMQFANPYLFSGNNPVVYIDKDGKWIWVIPLIAGAFNVASNWNNFHGFWEGASYFAAGAVSGYLSLYGNPLAGAALYGASNSALTQGYKYGFKNIDWLSVGASAATSAGIAYGGRLLTPLLSPLTENISSPVLREGLANAATSSVLGTTAGTITSLANGNDLSDALKDGAQSGLSGFTSGFITGAGYGYVESRANDINPWTGRPERITLSAKELGIDGTLDRIQRGESHPHKHDNTPFRNDKQILPVKPENYYKEYVHPTPGVSHAGKQRIVIGNEGDIWYTPDHYHHFFEVKKY